MKNKRAHRKNKKKKLLLLLLLTLLAEDIDENYNYGYYEKIAASNYGAGRGKIKVNHKIKYK